MSTRRFDAIVVGGGLAGRAAAVALGQAELSVLHLAPKGATDRRTSALMGPSVAFLQSLGALSDPPSFGAPLRRIRIIDATGRLIRAPEALFDCREIDTAAFGWNLPNTALAEALDREAAALPSLVSEAKGAQSIGFEDGSASVALSGGEIAETSLVVGADGKASLVRAAAGIEARERKFAQAALVADLKLGRPLIDTSVEFHYPNGPFTLVPAGENRANLVWIDDRATLEAAKSNIGALPSRLAALSQHLFGTIEIAGPVVTFPLSTLTVSTAGAKAAVLVGESAHAFPPIGAQGLNLGLRDVADLTNLLPSKREAGWEEELSRRYAERRAGDLARTGATVDALFRSLIAEMLPAQAIRAGGLWALKLLPPLRRQAFVAGMGAR